MKKKYKGIIFSAILSGLSFSSLCDASTLNFVIGDIGTDEVYMFKLFGDEYADNASLYTDAVVGNSVWSKTQNNEFITVYDFMGLFVSPTPLNGLILTVQADSSLDAATAFFDSTNFSFGGYTSGTYYNYNVKYTYDIGSDIGNYEFSSVPVPAAVWLLGSGLAGLVALRRKKS